MKFLGSGSGRALIFLLIAVAAHACSQTRPIHNVENEPVTQHSPPLTLKQIEARILDAGPNVNWRLKAIGPGKIEGLRRVKRHSATVSIDYDQRFYSIRYKSSYRLKAGSASKNDPREGQFLIHYSYNRHIRTLQDAINHKLRSASQ